MSRETQRLPVLLLLFAGSGCAALIYEVVWLQLLQLVLGSSAVSTGVLLATFMGGMSLGSLLLARFVDEAAHPLRVFAVLELTIGILGMVVLALVPLAGSLYAAMALPAAAAVPLRAVIAAVCLLPPALLMGATLPAISRWLEPTREGASRLGLLYAGNIAGAVAGCLLAGFYLLRVHDMRVATAAAVTLNTTVGLAALSLSWRLHYRKVPTMTQQSPAPAATAGRIPYIVAALSGLSALGAEVVWTRELSLVLGPTVYTFSIILAVFLLGLGLGSGIGATISRRVAPVTAMAAALTALAVAIAWAAWTIVDTLPFQTPDPDSLPDAWTIFGLDIGRSAWAMLPAAMLWGAVFPLALAAVIGPGADSGRRAGSLYAANTLGAIAGALGFGLLVVPLAGTQNAQRLLILVCAIGALVCVAAIPRRALMAAAAALLVALAALWTVPETPGLLVAYGRQMAAWANTPPEVLYVGEGVHSSVAVTEWPNGMRQFHVAGKVEASTANTDMRLQRMLGHLSALAHPAPRSVLVVGFGSGVTAGSFVQYPGIERIVICEIEPLIPRQVASYFAEQNHHVLDDPRVEVVYDDARHYIQTTGETFDIITSDPIHPWVKGAAALYTAQYFETLRRHLNPGGVISQWVPLYDSTEEVVKSELATFFRSFPAGALYSNDIAGRGYDVVLLWRDGAIDIAGQNPPAQVLEALREVGFPSVQALAATRAVDGADLQTWLSGAVINTDRNLRLQYLAGLNMNFTDADTIYQTLLNQRP